MPALPEIAYAPGPRRVGLLHAAVGPVRRLPVLLIHGGGWQALSKETVEPIARRIAASGRAVFAVDYRLIPADPWPACRDDVAAAARFLLDGGLATHGVPAPDRIVVVGASAGGHLALHVALDLGVERVAGVVSLAGPARVDARDDGPRSAIARPGFLADFFGPAFPPTLGRLDDASPARRAHPQAPPLVVIHSRIDEVVPPSHAREVVDAWRAAGVPARVDWFDGRDRDHGFWTTPRLEDRDLVPEVACLLDAALGALP